MVRVKLVDKTSYLCLGSCLFNKKEISEKDILLDGGFGSVIIENIKLTDNGYVGLCTRVSAQTFNDLYTYKYIKDAEDEITNFIKDKSFDEVVKRVKLLMRMGMLEALDNKQDFKKGVIDDYVKFFDDENIEDFI